MSNNNNKAKHTPGPWRADMLGNGLPWDHPSALPNVLITAKGGNVASVSRSANPRRAMGAGPDAPDHDDCREAVEIRDANARLIAAAPDLLAACKAVQAVVLGNDKSKDRYDLQEILAAVIAKAEGK